MAKEQKWHRYRLSVTTIATCALMVAGCSNAHHTPSADNGPSTSTHTTTTTAAVVLNPGTKIVRTVDQRFQSYNIEMVEVTGGSFWQPYGAGKSKVVRPPIDLGSAKLRNLARALGPAYIRVSGSWATNTYFDFQNATGGKTPEGFQGVLTPNEWKGVGSFADAVGGKIVTSFAGNAAVRTPNGEWNPDQARALLTFSTANHIPLVAAELFNEVNLPVGMPSGYTAADFARDVATFIQMRNEVDPSLKLVGPGTTAEVTPMIVTSQFSAADVLKHTGNVFNVFSYHSYPKVSERCGSKEGPDIAFTNNYLTRVANDTKHYLAVRNEFMPKAPVWLTETAQAACGGDRWAATYRDVIRYVDTLGRLANQGVDVVFHNTLAASDYGLLDENNFDPRPDYWAAVLWHRLMGPQVVSTVNPVSASDLTVYGHCTPSPATGTVAWAVVNSSTNRTQRIATGSGKGTEYQITSSDLDGKTVTLNGSPLKAGSDGNLPAMTGKRISGAIDLPPASVTFVVTSNKNSACTQTNAHK